MEPLHSDEEVEGAEFKPMLGLYIYVSAEEHQKLWNRENELLGELQHARNQYEQLRQQSIQAQNYLNAFADENKKLHDFINDMQLRSAWAMYKAGNGSYEKRKEYQLQIQRKMLANSKDSADEYIKDSADEYMQTLLGDK